MFSANSNWQQSVLMNDQSPVARDLVTWLTVTDTSRAYAAGDLIRFALEHSNWPRLYMFRDRIEKAAATLRPADAAAWFDQNPPQSPEGIKAYLSALTALKQEPRLKPALRKFWTGANLDKKETAALAAQYKPLFTPADHAARLDNLLWEMRFQEAEAMLPLVGDDLRKLAEARIALGRLSSKSPTFIKAVPAALQGDSGLLFSRLNYRRAMGKDDDAFEILQKAPRNANRPDLWWKERNILARRAIEKRHFGRAYQIINGHGLADGADYSVAEWTLGWLELEFLGHPDKAYQHFERFSAAVKSAVSRSRAAFWLARAAEKMHQAESAQNWYKLGAQFPSTFYGQLCYEALHAEPVSNAFTDDQVPPEAQQSFDQDERVMVVRLLARDRLQNYIDPFLTKLLDGARTRADFVLTARLANEAGRRHFAVEANKQLQMKLGDFMFTEGYPLLPTVPASEPESALIHAIVHRESMFNTEAQSPAGARGLMQLMPGTAKQVAHSLGKGYSADQLTGNPRYNIELGSAYLQRLIKSYDGFYPLAIAAYNAGPANVAEWMREFGDPRSKRINLLDWIEQIPIYETRNYIQRVMESYYVYKMRLGEEPQTVMAFKE